jgi:hypothetical protein
MIRQCMELYPIGGAVSQIRQHSSYTRLARPLLQLLPINYFGPKIRTPADLPSNEAWRFIQYLGRCNLLISRSIPNKTPQKLEVLTSVI